MEDDDETREDTNSRTNGPVLLGAKSGIGREATDRQKLDAGKGLELTSLTEKEGGNSPGIRTNERRKRINSQNILNSMPVHDQLLSSLMIRDNKVRN